MIALFKFILCAIANRHAYIDLDGCLLRRQRCPPGMSADNALAWWGANLGVARIIYSRLALCYLLRLCGVRLHIWTNRWYGRHEGVTYRSLGTHKWLFNGAPYFANGNKAKMHRDGPCMDDQAKFLGTQYCDLLVKQL